MRVDSLSSQLGDLIKTDSAHSQPTGASQASFTDALKNTLQEINQRQQQADVAMSKGAVEGAGNIHESMIQLEEADISTRLLLKVRTKALDAYQEIMRMQF
jgi:flagellar hook-basal body complex protein FliE